VGCLSGEFPSGRRWGELTWHRGSERVSLGRVSTPSAEHRPETWLPLVQEDIVEPDLVIVDPHHHLWDYKGRPGYQPTYLLDELHADTGSGHRIEATVFVECSWAYRTDGPHELREVGETAFVASVAAHSLERVGQARIGGIVGACDLTLGARLDGVLDAHESAGAGLFRGIRHRLAFDPAGAIRTSATEPNTEGLMGTDSFRAGVALLGRRGLTFDAWLYHVQLPELVVLARAVPGTTIILDHIGAPLGVGAYAGRREEIHAQWRSDLAEVATCPNVVVKVGGIGMPAYGNGYELRELPATSDQLVADWGENMRFIIEQFGASRCMFESNFPVDKVSFSYAVMWNAYKKMSVGYSPEDRSMLLAGTARRVYRVD
jgi:L-fuconolactonase